MRNRMLLVVAIFVIAMALVGPAYSAAPPNPPQSAPKFPAGCGKLVSVQDFRPLAAAIWDGKLWERGQPGQAGISAYTHALHCAKSPAHRQAIKATWAKEKHAFYQYRGNQIKLHENKSFEYPDGSFWAVPYPIAWCESGGNYYVGPAGAYGLIFALNRTPREQDEIAYHLYLEQGEAPWAPYESGCAYR